MPYLCVSHQGAMTHLYTYTTIHTPLQSALWRQTPSWVLAVASIVGSSCCFNHGALPVVKQLPDAYVSTALVCARMKPVQSQIEQS